VPKSQTEPVKKTESTGTAASSDFGRSIMQFYNTFGGMNKVNLWNTKGYYNQPGPTHLNPLQFVFTIEIPFPK
jgi:hypothetical protein